MMKPCKGDQRKRAFANKLHKEIFSLIFLATLFPTVIAVVLVYYLIFTITADYIAIPEVISTTVIPAAQRVMMLLFIASPITVIAILMYASSLTHKILGPFDRIIADMDARISGEKEGPIFIRKNDKFKPLVERINTLLTRCGLSSDNNS